MLAGSRTNPSTLANGTPNESNAAQGEKQAGGRVEKLETNAFSSHAQAGLPGDAKDEKPVSKENGHASD
jgi:hypothetical protein